MQHPTRRTPLILVTLFASLVALSGCGDDNGAERTRNAALDTRTCAEGGQCAVGDKGPGGGVVFYDAGSDREWGRYLEAAQPYWGDGLPEEMKGNNYNIRGGEIAARVNEGALSPSAPFSPSNTALGGGKAAWETVKDFRCNRCVTSILAEYNKGAISDWYLPNKRELGELFNSNVRQMNSPYYWTSTGATSSSKQLVRMSINFSARVFEFWYRYQGEYWMFLPIRAFSSTPIVETTVPETTTIPEETTTTTEATTTTIEATTTTTTTPRPVLKPVTNVQVEFQGNYMNVTFARQRDGLEPDGHFVNMDWPTGRNNLTIDKNAFVTSIYIPPYFQGGKVGVSVRSYTNSTQPSQTVDTDVIVFDIPSRKPEAAPIPPVTPVSDEEVTRAVVVLDEPILHLPEQEVESVVNREELLESVESQLPEITVQKVEVQIITPDSEMDEPFVELTSNNTTSFAIPVDATQVNVLVTGSQGEVVEQNKLIVRVNDEGTEVSSADVPGSISTTVSEENTPQTTVATTPIDTESDDSTGSSPWVWLLVAAAGLLAAVFGVRQLRR